MTYLADAVTQRDGSSYQNENCGCATAATAIDFHTTGGTISTGQAMRERNPDQSGGTDWYDMRDAWSTYGETLTVKNGQTWANARADLMAGRLVLLSVWHATLGGPCLSGSGQYGHGVAIAPPLNSDGARWRVGDPWCKPGSWSWWAESKIKAAAEEFGGQVYGRDAGGPRELPEIELRRRVKELLDRWTPERPSPTRIDVGGKSGGPILYAVTRENAGDGGGGDMRFVNASGYAVGSGLRLHVEGGSDWQYLDGVRGGDFSKDAELVVLGLADSHSGAYVVQITTGGPYADSDSRPTLVLVETSARPYDAPTTPAPADELTAVELRIGGEIVYDDLV